MPVRYEKDERNRQVVVYVDTDSMSDEDYAEYCRLHDETLVLRSVLIIVLKQGKY